MLACAKCEDEDIFQYARRIATAQYQHIVFNEWLPLLIGEELAKKLDLIQEEGKFSEYNPYMDASVRNGFATAAFR